MKKVHLAYAFLQFLSVALAEAESDARQRERIRSFFWKAAAVSSPRDRWRQGISSIVIRSVGRRNGLLRDGGLVDVGWRERCGDSEGGTNEFDEQYHCTSKDPPRIPPLNAPSRGRRSHQSVEHVASSRQSGAIGARSTGVIVASSSSASFQDASVASRPQRSGMWPPWPFNLLQSQGSSSSEDGGTTVGTAEAAPLGQGMGPAASLLMTFLQKSAHAGLLNLQYMSSQLLFHLPPASPPLLLLACIPQHRKVQQLLSPSTTMGTAESHARMWTVPLTSDPFVRTIALSCLGLAVLSWAHSQVHRLNAMTPLPIAPEFQDVHRAVLPPFLPEEEHHRFLEDERLLEDALDSDSLSETALPTYFQSMLQWNPFGDGRNSAVDGGRLRGALRAWRQEREARRMDRHNAHRIAVMDQLLALQSLKRKSAERRKGKKSKSRSGGSVYGTKSTSSSIDERTGQTMGYGVVTGASRGIGRAIAVELARFGIPLVLVARDLDRLTSLAYDLQACYGIDCCVLQADLTQPHAATAVYRSIQDAGLTVDILVNNAGLSSHGLSVDFPTKSVDDMLSVNVQAVTTLTHLFGRDMKERRRGRILMVSSVNGAVSGVPTVSVYTATKAFERTLATSLAREMEPYGVGVTCLLPGAVRDTDFRTRSNAQGALCWKIPFYLKSPAQVAEMGVRALLMGQPEVTPGWMNRVFLKVVQPALPPRMHSLMAEVMWNPIRMPWHRSAVLEAEDASRGAPEPSPVSPPHNDPPTRGTRLRYKFDSAPRLLTLEDSSLPLEALPPGNSNSTESAVEAPSSDTSTAADPASAIPTILENESSVGHSVGPELDHVASSVTEKH